METENSPSDAPESSPNTPDDSPVEAPQSDSMDVRAAFEQAWSEMDGADEEAPGESEDAPPEAPETAEPTDTPETPTRQFTEQQAFDRALTLHRAGRTHELPPEVQGQIRKWEADTVAAHQEAQQNEIAFNEMYLELLALEEEDPAEFNKLLRDPESGKDRLDFMAQYAAQHPDVTLDNPRPGPKAKAEEEIRREQDAYAGERLDAALRAFAEDHGVKNYDEIRTASGTGKASLLVSVMQATADATAAKQVDQIRKAERDAALKEAMATYGSRIPDLSVSSSGRGSRSQPGRDPGSVREAFDMFEESLSNA